MGLLRENSGRRHIPFAFGAELFTSDAGERVTAIFALLLGTLLPLALHKGYFDITETKQIVFLSLTTAYLLALLLLLCLQKSRLALLAALGTPFRMPDACMAAFVLSGVAGALLSGLSNVFFAPDNRYQGVFSLLLYAIVYFGVARLYNPKGWHAALPLGAFAIVCALGALQRCGVDLLLLRENLRPLDRGRFLSAIGNIDFYGAYICLVFPALPYLLCRTEQWGRRVCFLLLLACGLAGALSAGGDGAAAALLASGLLTPLLLKGRPREARRLLAVYVGMLLFAKLFALLAGRSNSGYYFSHLTRLILHPAVTGILTVLCLAGILLLCNKRIEDGKTSRVYRLYCVLLLALLFASVLAALLINTVWANAELNSVTRFLRFDENWGTDRGKIWRFCLETYGTFPWPQRVLGGGPGCVLRADSLSPLFSDALVDTAHSEYLQYLLTCGALGLIAYCGLIVFTCRKALACRTPYSDALLLCVLAYAVQAAVGIAQPATTPLFFLLVALLRAQQKTPT